MKNKMLVDIVKSKNVVIPLYLYKLKDKLDISMDEFMLMMYLYNEGELVLFDLNRISNELGLKINDLMNMIGILNGKGLIELKVITNDKNVMEEYISLENFYNKISLLLMDSKEEQEEDNSNVFSMIEQEFGKTLSPIEYEIIKAWLESNKSVELIGCALKESVMNGVRNLRYMDKILYEWEKKGIRTKADVESHMNNRRKKEESKKVDVFDYDWLDE
ncbi:MAG: DnaD domain protein [Firmicutes bacterium]|nr:DnaD domain protein [Bacillota bacterium]